MRFAYQHCLTCKEETLHKPVRTFRGTECIHCGTIKLRQFTIWTGGEEDGRPGRALRASVDIAAKASMSKSAAKARLASYVNNIFAAPRGRREWEKRKRITKTDLPCGGRRGAGEHGDMAFQVDMSANMADVPQGVLDSIQEASA